MLFFETLSAQKFLLELSSILKGRFHRNLHNVLFRNLGLPYRFIKKSAPYWKDIVIFFWKHLCIAWYSITLYIVLYWVDLSVWNLEGVGYKYRLYAESPSIIPDFLPASKWKHNVELFHTLESWVLPGHPLTISRILKLSLHATCTLNEKNPFLFRKSSAVGQPGLWIGMCPIYYSWGQISTTSSTYLLYSIFVCAKR